VTNVSQARELTSGDLAKVTAPYTALSLKLQAAFGLPREESIKIMPDWADRDDLLVLKASWTTGGRQREIPVCTAQQLSYWMKPKCWPAGAVSYRPR